MSHVADIKLVLEHIYGKPSHSEKAVTSTMTAHKSSLGAAHIDNYGGNHIQAHKDAAREHRSAFELHKQARAQVGHDYKQADYHNLMIQHHETMHEFHKKFSA